MKSLQNYIEDYQKQYITEMATIAKSVKLGKDSLSYRNSWCFIKR